MAHMGWVEFAKISPRKLPALKKGDYVFFGTMMGRNNPLRDEQFCDCYILSYWDVHGT